MTVCVCVCVWLCVCVCVCVWVCVCVCVCVRERHDVITISSPWERSPSTAYVWIPLHTPGVKCCINVYFLTCHLAMHYGNDWPHMTLDGNIWFSVMSSGSYWQLLSNANVVRLQKRRESSLFNRHTVTQIGTRPQTCCIVSFSDSLVDTIISRQRNSTTQTLLIT